MKRLYWIRRWERTK